MRKIGDNWSTFWRMKQNHMAWWRTGRRLRRLVAVLKSVDNEEETNMENPQSWRMKVPATIEASKPIKNFEKKAMEESIIEELSKKFEVVSLATLVDVGQREEKRIDVCGATTSTTREGSALICKTRFARISSIWTAT